MHRLKLDVFAGPVDGGDSKRRASHVLGRVDAWARSTCPSRGCDFSPGVLGKADRAARLEDRESEVGGVGDLLLAGLVGDLLGR